MLHSPGDPNFSAWGTGVDEVLAGKLDTTVASSTYVSKVAPPTGVSATDTANITAAIAALPATGGELRFPAGTYVTTGGFTIAVPVTVIGVGMAGLGNGQGSGSLSAGTEITCTSQTADLFTITAPTGRFAHVALRNTASLAPTAGSAIRVTSALITQSVSYDGISVLGFYDNVSVEVGCGWYMRGCRILGPVRYGLRVQNIVNADAGDWSVSDSIFWSSVYNSLAGIRIDSSGGGKITNCKINANVSSYLALHGIDINYVSGIGTGDFAISNCSIENVSGNGINLYAATGALMSKVSIVGCQISLLGTNLTGYPIAIAAQTVYTIANVAIAGCLLDSNGSVPSINLTNMATARIGSTAIGGNNTAQYSATGCTNVKSDADPIIIPSPIPFEKPAQSGAVTFNLSQGLVQVCRMVGNVTSWAFTNPPAVGTVAEVWFAQDATGSRTLAGGGARLANGNILTLTTTPNRFDIITLRYYGGGWWETSRSMNI
jgi:hypothetical protein